MHYIKKRSTSFNGMIASNDLEMSCAGNITRLVQGLYGKNQTHWDWLFKTRKYLNILFFQEFYDALVKERERESDLPVAIDFVSFIFFIY